MYIITYIYIYTFHTGSAQATLTSEAENEWDGDRSHGVGDYRIPIPLRQNINGSAIPEADKFPNKGVYCNINNLLLV